MRFTWSAARSSAIAILLCSSSSALAQLPAWSSVPVSNPPLFQHEQTVLGVTDGTAVHAWSAFTRKWSTIQGAFGTPLVQRYNEHLIVQDGPLFWGYSPRTGAFQAQFTFSPGAFMFPAPLQSWHSVIVDGNQVHMYFALTGHWTTFSFASPPSITFGRMCVLIDDGTTVYAVSSNYGSLVPCPSTGASVLSAFTGCGFAHAGGELFGFSANTNRWVSMPVSSVPAISTGAATSGCFAWIDDFGVTSFFSAQTGAFLTMPSSAGASVTIKDFVALVVDGPTVYGYSGLSGKAAVTTFATTPSVIVNSAYGVIDDGSAVTAFSAATSSFSPPLAGSFSITPKGHVAYLESSTPGGTNYGYSAYRNQFVAAPVLSSPAVYSTGTALLLVDAGAGFHAFSTRSATWVFQAAPTPDVVHANINSLLVRTGQDLFAFNPRTSSWHMQTVAAPVTNVNLQYTALVVSDGVNAYGFSQYNDAWSTIALAGPAQAQAAQVQSAYVYDGVEVHAFSGIGQVSTNGDVPDYWRAVSWGGRLRIDVAGEPFAMSTLLFGLAPGSVPTGIGTLLIDPSSIVLTLVIGVPPGGNTGLWMTLPEAPALSGLELYLQAMVSPNLGVPYLTPVSVTTLY